MQTVVLGLAISYKLLKDAKAPIIRAAFVERTESGTIEEIREDGKSPIESSESNVRNWGCETRECLHRSQRDIERGFQIGVRCDWGPIARASGHRVLDLLQKCSKMHGSRWMVDTNACNDAVLIKIPVESFSEKGKDEVSKVVISPNIHHLHDTLQSPIIEVGSLILFLRRNDAPNSLDGRAALGELVPGVQLLGLILLLVGYVAAFNRQGGLNQEAARRRIAP
jgi:hypothetical protein